MEVWYRRCLKRQIAPSARERYARARQIGVEKWSDQIIPMSDAVIGQPMEIVTATRNAVELRKWCASRLLPTKYGDHAIGVQINNTANVLVISEERQRELQAIRRQLLDGTYDVNPSS